MSWEKLLRRLDPDEWERKDAEHAAINNLAAKSRMLQATPPGEFEYKYALEEYEQAVEATILAFRRNRRNI